ncbi:hypothetical protein [Anabaena sp. CCY 9402-a]
MTITKDARNGTVHPARRISWWRSHATQVLALPAMQKKGERQNFIF